MNPTPPPPPGGETPPKPQHPPSAFLSPPNPPTPVANSSTPGLSTPVFSAIPNPVSPSSRSLDVDLEAMLSDEVNQRFLGLVSEVVGLVERVDVGLWSAPAQAEVLVGLLGFQTQIEAVVSQLAGLVDASMFWSTDGSRSAGAWLERQSGRDRKETNQIFRTGRDLREMPETENGFGAGVLSGRHVRVLAKAKNKVPELFG
ncbi:MAG: DUF222 domain-containing protein, partial [Acidimicrobiia bacterium]